MYTTYMKGHTRDQTGYEQRQELRHIPCYLCGRPSQQYEHRHDGPHTMSGPIRGIVCGRCNIGIGVAESVGVERMAAYLEASPIGPDYRQTVWAARNRANVRRWRAARNGV